jgi:hypothetical protein
MRLLGFLLLPVALASTITIYTNPLHRDPSHSASPIPSPTPLATVSYDAATASASLVSYHPPTGSYKPSHIIRVGLFDPDSQEWKGVVTSAASFADEYRKRFILHVDDRGEVYHVGFGTGGRSTGGNEVEIEVAPRAKGPQPSLNKPIVLNAEGKLEGKEPEKTFLQK